jgi:prespore-specific regulator
MKTRQDAWTHEDDLLLAETVLRYIREGGTQLAAFEEVGDKLNRTAAACGFRWNAEVRKRYVEAIELAKKQRKERKRALERAKKLQRTEQNSSQLISSSLLPAPNAITLEQCIAFLQSLNETSSQSQKLKEENERLKKKNEELQERTKQLEKKLAHLMEQQETIQEDYQALIKIMDRARKMVLMEEMEAQVSTHIFRMEKNENLEHAVTQ